MSLAANVRGPFDTRGPESLRSNMALCGFINKHSAAVLNGACIKALKNGTHRIKDIRRLIGEQAEKSSLNFVLSHPLIRDLTAYSGLINHPQQPNHDD